MPWDADRYDAQFSFVAAHGGAVLDLLDPRPGERVLDVGCGTGTLTVHVAERGADVAGLDADPAMVARARALHPGLDVRVGDARTFTVEEPYDAVLSNAALHWVDDQDAALAQVRAALRPGGRFVAEMGGTGNVAALVAAVQAARAEHGLVAAVPPWVFPTPGEQATRLERAGFVVRSMALTARPTPLDPGVGAAAWVEMFGLSLVADVPAAHRRALLEAVDRLAAPALRSPDGAWAADYVRLRFVAIAV